MNKATASPHNVTVIDQGAASELARREYYLEVERAQESLEAGRLCSPQPNAGR